MTFGASFGSDAGPPVAVLMATRERVENLVTPALEGLLPQQRVALVLAVTGLDFALYVIEHQSTDEDLREAFAALVEAESRTDLRRLGAEAYMPFADAATMLGPNLRFSRPSVGDIVDFIWRVIEGASNPKPKK